MGGLAHFIESAGIPTTQISLIRKHTQIIKPPRALWVPFELGRPFGAPNDPRFQERVLRAVLKLLEAPAGPVLEDFPDDAPDIPEAETLWACPVDFSPVEETAGAESDIEAAFRREIRELFPWYERSLKVRGRTTVGGSGLTPDQIADFMLRLLDDQIPQSPRPDIPPASAIKLAAEDLKAFYTEAATAQPGTGNPGSQQLLGWFWDETMAGRVLRMVRERCLRNPDFGIRFMGKALLVPMLKGD